MYDPYSATEVQANLDATPEAWKDLYETFSIKFLNSTEYFDGSQLCAHARREGLWEPHHHNCWVSMITSLAKKGYMEKLPGTRSEEHTSELQSH